MKKNAEMKKIPTRDGYGEGLVLAGKKNSAVVVLCCDLTESTRSKAFAEKFPNRFFEIGVAEQNMAGIAAGMALEGLIPFCSSYAVFNPGRNWDQVRVSICYNRANVKIVGAHAGISVGPDGATHQALEDIAIARVLPNMTVIVPCDYYQSMKATEAAAMHQGPVYLRFARSATPVMTGKNDAFEIGRAYVMKQGTDVTCISCGPLIYEALMAAREMESRGISVEVINNPSIKPLDEKTIVSSVQKTKAVVTVEEHQMYGGLRGAIAEFLTLTLPVPCEFVAMPDCFGESGEPDELIEKYGMSKKHVVKAIERVMKRKK
ncbi:MAG: transketolase family protein [Parcubacteria group bacterium]|nr:transketolase family protein [Parcubacteria group bacterium]